jgi:glycerol uptake facilitator-like aquaporin
VVGTAVLVFVGAGAIPALILFDGNASTGFTGPDLGFVALAFGLIVAPSSTRSGRSRPATSTRR